MSKAFVFLTLLLKGCFESMRNLMQTRSLKELVKNRANQYFLHAAKILNPYAHTTIFKYLR